MARHGKTLCAGIVVLIAVASLVVGQTSPSVGKKMPALKVRNWISTEKVTQDQLEGRPYVVEFWATWCPPCRKSTPHLVALARKYKPRDLLIIGVSRDRAGTESDVKKFYSDYKMSYPVAMDAGLGNRLEFDGIPHAFVVDHNNRIAWDGHPMDPVFEETMRGVLDKSVVRIAEFPKLRELAVAILNEGGKERIAELKGLLDDPEKRGEAKRLLSSVKNLVRAQSKVGAEHADEMPIEGVEELDLVARKFEGLEEAAEAREAAEAIRSDPSYADEVAVVSELKKFGVGLEQQLQSELAGVRDRRTQMRKALAIFRKAEAQLVALAEEYPKAKSAKRVNETLSEIRDFIAGIKDSVK